MANRSPEMKQTAGATFVQPCFYIFLVYSTTLSTCQTIYFAIVGVEANFNKKSTTNTAILFQ
jgi:hypothetical protein